MRRNCLLKPVIEGKIEIRIDVTGRRGRRRKQLLDDLKERGDTGNERGSTRSHYVEISLWKRPLTCHKTDYGMDIEGGGRSTYCIIYVHRLSWVLGEGF